MKLNKAELELLQEALLSYEGEVPISVFDDLLSKIQYQLEEMN